MAGAERAANAGIGKTSKTARTKRYVYFFEGCRATPETVMLLGGKGANLAEMTAIGLPVPPGFTITTEACREFYALKKRWPSGLEKEASSALAGLERKMGKKLGDAKNPLLVSVRSGSYVSMPGMMDTVLNLGMNDRSVFALAARMKNERAAWDCYRRFIQMFGDVVMKVPHSAFEEALHKKKDTAGVESDSQLQASDLKEVVSAYKSIVKKHTGKEFPQEPWQQLQMAVDAVFNSWNNERAIAYRRIHNLRHDAGTAVTVQSMVFGNLGNTSGTGVSFTRNPSTGAKEHYGEFLLNAQGEDVVAGIRTPQHIDELKKALPSVYSQLLKVYEKLERHYKEMQDFEFTIENGKLYLLQTRTGKRTANAAVRIAIEMMEEGLISREEAVLRVKPEQIDQLLHKQLDPVAKEESELIAKGLPASPGAAVGTAVFSAKRALEIANSDKDAKLILVRTETSPEDIEGMNIAQGILTARGGMTSHAAVVARGMGKCCVAGCSDISVNESAGQFSNGAIKIREGDWITLDGGTGEVFKGKLPVVEPSMSRDFSKLMHIADSFVRLAVRTNADTPKDAKIARDFGAKGIGLCRTEHMFFEGERINAMREMILAENEQGRRKALEKLMPMQRSDFIGIFRAMDGLPVTIRLLDPPLHEFLPKDESEIAELAKSMGVTKERLHSIVASLHELNPMLGHRGCRLGLAYPEINEMQARAIFEAALQAQAEGVKVHPEIEVPLVGMAEELKQSREMIEHIAEETGAKGKVKYKIGTMIELPRACITADEIAQHADFFSFGTNDLTQTTYGFSRDDSGKFLPQYIEKGILENDPFAILDRKGVGSLMRECIARARKAKPKLEIGICGEHGGEPNSVEFCHQIGLDYVSCSPYRVPIARLAAAHAALKEKMQKKRPVQRLE